LEHELVRNTPGNRTPTFDTPYGRIGIMICADRRDGDLVKRLCESRPSLLICPSGGMFGPQSNDPIVQARSKENGVPIVFVHPAEFLVTGPEGEVRSRTILGKQLEVAQREVGSVADQNEVLFFDVPLSRTTNATSRSRSDESR
jgi:predicted amidohydrolase